MPSLDVIASPEAVATENAKSVKVMQELITKLNISKSADELTTSVANLATFFTGDVLEKDAPNVFIDTLKKQMNNKKDAAARERAFTAVTGVASQSVNAAFEPYLVQLLPIVFAGVADKMVNVKNAAEKAAFTIVKAVNPNAVKALLPAVRDSFATLGNKWQVKVAGLKCVNQLVEVAGVQLSFHVPMLITAISEAFHDTKKEVKQTARDTMEKLCSLISNKDIEKIIPEIIKGIANPKAEVIYDTIHALGATTFVSEVRGPTLSVLVPLLWRGLEHADTSIKRKSAVIVANMGKLVSDPVQVAPFLPELLPRLQKNVENMSDPEARETTEKGLAMLKQVGNVGDDNKIPEISTASNLENLVAALKDVMAVNFKAEAAKSEQVISHAASIAGQLIDEDNAQALIWIEQIKPYIVAIIGEEKSTDADTIVNNLLQKVFPQAVIDEADEEIDEDGEVLVETTFKLAYAAKILLNDAHIRLMKGKIYALAGPNGCGKSTLLRAIVNEQVENFPTKEELPTVFVEHDLDAADTELSVLEWTTQKLASNGIKKSSEEIREQLHEFGFAPSQVDDVVTSLSGGWRMKLALARAVFEDPDLLLLDEPTNHLDVKNVAWLENYLKTSGRSAIIVSHESKFLNNVCDGIIHYENYRLKQYKGNLDAFIAKVPSAAAYDKISNSEIDFKFPDPGMLEGVKTKAKAIVKVNNMSFQYEGTAKPQIHDINFQCSLGSRIAVIGPNGAGKSTLINVLTGELVPTSGEVYTHENCRIAYIKQHAFAHIDNHLDKSIFQYIEWRYEFEDDRETLDRASSKITEADVDAEKKIYILNGRQLRVVSIKERKKLKNSYQYLCSFMLGEGVGTKQEKWTPLQSADDDWLPREDLRLSHAKKMGEVDAAAARLAGNFPTRSRQNIEKHCKNFGLDAELVSHTHIKSLSGGQRVKAVLAACTWLRPHLIVLDEPTNFLDRDSLGALSRALKAFEGGVVIITHSKEFTEDLTEEVWSVLDGMMTPSGHNWIQGQGTGARLTDKEEGEQFDSMGNKIDSNKKKTLSRKEIMKKKKDIAARRKRGEEVWSDEE